MNKTQLVEMISNIALKELARIPSLFKLASTDPSEIQSMMPDDLKKSSTAKNIIDFYQQNGNEPASIGNIVTHYEYPAQQAVNTQFLKLKNAGVLVSTGLAFPKAEKPTTSGLKGRPVSGLDTRSDDEKLKFVISKLKNSQEPSPEYKNWFVEKYNSENYEKLKNLVDTFQSTITKDEALRAQQELKSFLGGLGFVFKKRGRKPGEPSNSVDIPGKGGTDDVSYEDTDEI